MMEVAPKFDLTAKTAEQLRSEFEIKLVDSKVLFWEKTGDYERIADISISKNLFREDVLRDLEKSHR